MQSLCFSVEYLQIQQASVAVSGRQLVHSLQHAHTHAMHNQAAELITHAPGGQPWQMVAPENALNWPAAH